MEDIIMTAEQPIQSMVKKMRVMKYVANLAVYVLIIAGIIFGLPNFLVWKLHTTYPMAAITSGSMWPVLKEGDLVFIEGITAKENIHVGDIVVFRNRQNGTLTIHRVVTITSDKITTKGDANFGTDNPVAYEDVIGKTYNIGEKPLHIPYLGSVTMFANKLKNNAQVQ